jgi:hypothetical protein
VVAARAVVRYDFSNFASEHPDHGGQMQRRAILLLVLLGVLVLFYMVASSRSMTGIAARQESQTATLEQLDERALGGPGREAKPQSDDE